MDPLDSGVFSKKQSSGSFNINSNETENSNETLTEFLNLFLGNIRPFLLIFEALLIACYQKIDKNLQYSC